MEKELILQLKKEQEEKLERLLAEREFAINEKVNDYRQRLLNEDESNEIVTTRKIIGGFDELLCPPQITEDEVKEEIPVETEVENTNIEQPLEQETDEVCCNENSDCEPTQEEIPVQEEIQPEIQEEPIDSVIEPPFQEEAPVISEESIPQEEVKVEEKPEQRIFSGRNLTSKFEVRRK